MKFPAYYCAERTLDVDVEPFHVRLWLDAVAWPYSADRDTLLRSVQALAREAESMEGLLDGIAEFPGVNAIQVTHKRPWGLPGRDGVMAYLVPFDNKP